MNGALSGDLFDEGEEVEDLDSIREFVIPRILSKKMAEEETMTPDGRQILRNVKPPVEISRKFCPDVRRTSSYPDITKHADDKTNEVEAQLQKQKVVNTELKRLLIASVGDNLATKLEKLAREKAHLNEQVNILAKQTASDAERIENLVIQGDIWKSKFLAARVVVNELSLWKDTVSSKLEESQRTLHRFEEYSKRICYTLHEADRTLGNTVVEVDGLIGKDDIVLQRLKEASRCIADLLTNHTIDMCSFDQLSDLPSEPASTPNMYTDTSLYTYHEIPERGAACDDCCNGHSEPPSREEGTRKEEHQHQQLDHRQKSERQNVTLSYEACKQTMFLGSCKSCAEKEILHL